MPLGMTLAQMSHCLFRFLLEIFEHSMLSFALQYKLMSLLVHIIHEACLS